MLQMILRAQTLQFMFRSSKCSAKKYSRSLKKRFQGNLRNTVKPRFTA